MATRVAGDQYESITGQLFEIGRQLRQSNGYPFDPVSLQRHLQCAIEGQFNLVGSFSIWKSVKRPANASAAYYRAEFAKKGIQISRWANDILDKVDFAEGSDEVDIARPNVRDIGFTRTTRRDTIYEKLLARGARKLPAWAAVELCNTYDDQPKGEWLVAAMEPIADSDGNPRLFFVVRYDDGLQWLSSRWGGADCVWRPERVFLVAVPRK